MPKTKIAQIAYCALFAALSAVLSQVSIAIGPVPINLTHVSIFLAAGLLGAAYGTFSQTAFVLLGAAGAPVFSGFKGGIGVLLGPTGGFILGYIACAALTGWLISRLGRTMVILPLAMAAGLAATYLLGVLWFMFVMQTGLAAALTSCVWPFLPGDALKIILSSVLVYRLYPILQKMRAQSA